MTDRLTVDTITSDQLASLQLKAARMEHAVADYAKLRVELEDAERERDEHKQSYLGACATIAAMHAAAVGRSDLGPVRGVVEDVEDVRLRAEQAEAAVERVRKAIAERRTEVAEHEADGMLPFGTAGASWCDAVTVTCDRVEDALRAPSEPCAALDEPKEH